VAWTRKSSLVHGPMASQRSADDPQAMGGGKRKGPGALDDGHDFPKKRHTSVDEINAGPRETRGQEEQRCACPLRRTRQKKYPPRAFTGLESKKGPE